MHATDSTIQKSQTIMNTGGIPIWQDTDVNFRDTSECFNVKQMSCSYYIEEEHCLSLYKIAKIVLQVKKGEDSL